MPTSVSGTIPFSTGASSVSPHPVPEGLTNDAVATAGLRAWAHALHAAVAPKDVPKNTGDAKQ